MKITPTKAERAQAIEDLRQMFPEGSTVYTIVRSIARSGMSREISVLCIHDKSTVYHPNWSVAAVTGITLNRGGWRDGLIVKGCGFNHSQYIADMVSIALYGKEGVLQYNSL